jgi:hypothetical protein
MPGIMFVVTISESTFVTAKHGDKNGSNGKLEL